MLRYTKMIDNAVRIMKRHGVHITPRAVQINAGGYLPNEIADAVDNDQIDRVVKRLKVLGYRIADDITRERIEFIEMTSDQVEVQEAIQQENEVWVVKHRQAMTQTLAFMRQQEKALGRTVTAGEFRPQIEAIYAKNGVDSPFR